MAGNYRRERKHDDIEAQQREQDLAYRRKHEEDKYIRESYLRIAEEARAQGVWLYDPADRSWYNPNEFIATFKWYIAGHEKVMERIQFKDPKLTLEKAHKALWEFAERIINYEREARETKQPVKKA
ncbi:hypothetical protein AB6735_18650 [Mucilaginibacter sp. RCC_168]|uniref:hypothetical protein n=1 Tax=Mucilaginibacter sp. RCC_168 TaxID=3239221 RepID=UPI00352518F5